MRSRLLFIIRYFIHLVVLFALQKPLFMLFAGEHSWRFTDCLNVMWHGLSMDLSTAAYLCVVPWLIAIASLWLKGIKPKKHLRPYNIIIALALSLVFVADISLYPFWQFKLDASVFIYLDNPSDAAASVSAGYLAIRILAIAAYAIVVYLLLNRTTPKSFDYSQDRPKGRVASVVALLLAGGLVFLAIRGGVKESVMNVGRAYFCDRQFLNHSAVNPAFSLFSSIGKSKDFSRQYRFMSEEKAQVYFDSFYNQGRDTSLSIKLLNTRRPNVLVIEMESFGSTYTDPQIPGYSRETVAPNWWRIAEEGILFSNLWCNSYRTDRGTVSIFSAWPAFPKTSLMKQPKVVEKLPRLAEAFLRDGYSTHFLYGGDINFTNTKGYLITNGFRNLIADTDFTQKEQKSNKWGVDDAITFRFLEKQLKDLDSPWFYGFLTLSSHEPFDVPEKLLEDKVLNSAAYTDRCLGMLIDSLRNSPVWDNLLIVILPDHNMLYGQSYGPEYFKNRMIWTGGAISAPGTEINTIMNQSDVAATLLAQLGMSIENFPLSRNILSPSYTVPSAFCCYNNGFIVADTLSAITYNLDMMQDNGPEDKETAGKALLQSLYDKLDSLTH
ncbi:MAG: sulfatase-like hydrolase/transferase [Bacteroidales bacterium]|nr:sulfatase-like hydrolase/transferase [Bacteroidales bacterium]